MEQIAKLLFATTVVTIFMYLLVYMSVGQAGNGGEYWGFDGSVSPERAAGQSYAQGDYRFLEVFLEVGTVGDNGMPRRRAPNAQRCDNHPFGAEHSLRSSSTEPLHGADSWRLAVQFAGRYNWIMTLRLMDTMDGRCEQWVND